jgi:hypothetical protein
MAFVKTLALANLAVQILLVVMVSGAAYLAKKKDLKRHCTFMRVLVPVQLIAIASVMLPSMLGYLTNPQAFNTEMLIHHTLGLSVIALWLYINLSFGKAWMPRNFALFMRSAFTLWILALLIGLHMYIQIYA